MHLTDKNACATGISIFRSPSWRWTSIPVCGWNPDMYGVRNLPEGQLYYDSLLDTVEAKELWSGRQLTLNSSFSAAVSLQRLLRMPAPYAGLRHGNPF